MSLQQSQSKTQEVVKETPEPDRQVTAEPSMSDRAFVAGPPAPPVPNAYSNPDYPWASNYVAPDRAVTNPGWAHDPDEVAAHQARVREILGDTYQMEANDPRLQALTEWTDPLATAPEMPDFLLQTESKFEAEGVGEGKLNVNVGDQALGLDAELSVGDLGLAVNANTAWDQEVTGLETEGGHYTALGNAINMLGGPVGSATSTDINEWGIGVDGKARGVGLSAEVEGSNSQTSAYYAAIQNFPIEGLQSDLTDPVSQAARQAYIDKHPEEFSAWMQERRDAVLGGAETLSEFDWQNLQGGEAVSFSEFDKLGGSVGAEYKGIGVSLGGSDEDVNEVTMAMSDEGMLDVAVTAMDKGTAELGLSVLGQLSLDMGRTEGDVSQVKFSIDTTTAEGQQQATLFTEFGLFPGAIDTLPEESRAQIEEYLGHRAAQEDYPFGDALTAPDIDIDALVKEANSGFLTQHQEGDLPTAGATTYQNMEVAEIEGSQSTLGVGGVDILQSSYEQVMSENRYRNEQGLTESEYAVSTSIDREAWEVPLVGWTLGSDKHVDSFALSNPEFNEDLALFAGITGDYDAGVEVPEGQQAAYTVSMTDDQMAGLDTYLDSIGGAEEALFNEDSADYFFTANERRTDSTSPEHQNYVGHDGNTYNYQGEGPGVGNGHNLGAAERAQMMGIDVDQEVLGTLAEDQRAEVMSTMEWLGEGHDIESTMNYLYGDSAYSSAQGQILTDLDQKLAGVTSVEDFRALEDPRLQSMYIQSSAMRLAYEDKNPMLAVSLAFELEDVDTRNEVIRDVLAHLPETGVQHLGELIEQARASDPELAALLEGAVEEGTIDAPEE